MILIRIIIVLFFGYSALWGQNCKSIIIFEKSQPESRIIINDSVTIKSGEDVFLSKGKNTLRIVLNAEEWDSPFFSDTLIVNDDDTTNIYRYNEIKYSHRLRIKPFSKDENKTDLLANFRKKDNYISSGEFRWLLAGVVILGGTAAYLKIEADKKYDNYISSGEERFLEETRKYDLLSGISFGLLQLNFIYMVLNFLIF